MTWYNWLKSFHLMQASIQIAHQWSFCFNNYFLENCVSSHLSTGSFYGIKTGGMNNTGLQNFGYQMFLGNGHMFLGQFFAQNPKMVSVFSHHVQFSLDRKQQFQQKLQNWSLNSLFMNASTAKIWNENTNLWEINDMTTG